MDSSFSSQVTLVDVAPPRELVFAKNSVLNGPIFQQQKLKLTLSTPDASGSKTYIKDAYGQELVAIKKHRFSDDTIKFSHRYGGEKVKLKTWLSKGKLSDGYDCWTIQTPVGAYIWRVDVQTRFSLYHDADPTNPLAWARPGPPLGLCYKAVAEDFLDLIIASFILIEQQMRMEEKWIRIGEGMAADERANIFGKPVA